MAYSGLQGAPIKFPKAKSPKASGARQPKAKKACKYGPRDADGYCPKKPRASVGTRIAAGTLGVKVPKASSRQSSGEKLAKQVARSAATRATTAAVRAGTRAGKDFARGASETIAEYGGGAAVAKALAPRLLGVAAAGIAAYLLTKTVLERIRSAKDKTAAQRAAVADAYRRTRLDAAAALGRPLNAGEQKSLAAYFKQQAAKIGWRI